MKPEMPPNLSPVGRKFFDLIEFDENERLLCEIRKHPFGLFAIYATGGALCAAVLGLMLWLSIVSRDSSTFGADSGTLSAIVLLTGIFVTGVVALGTIIHAIIYSNNVLFVTNEKVAQVLYTSLFSRKISQLNIGNVQDVTVTQTGILGRAFDYGNLTIETAGEQQNYTFTFAPSPYQQSRCIISAHEEYEKRFGN